MQPAPADTPQAVPPVAAAAVRMETVDTAPYNNMQPAPEYEPAQPSTSVVSETGGQQTPATDPGQTQNFAPVHPNGQPAPQAAVTDPIFAAQVGAPGHGHQEGLVQPDPFDPFSNMRPPAPPTADPDEFARKLQEALGPIGQGN